LPKTYTLRELIERAAQDRAHAEFHAKTEWGEIAARHYRIDVTRIEHAIEYLTRLAEAEEITEQFYRKAKEWEVSE
jgi:hypothetical protein